ncbi:MAG: hypothetical protein GFH27_549311n179 [Chloroflexi bacterium AL-W]|nr:hypothetical protein [Chloroflexi bacterium AL-N1]NOK68643.1 hypothetical protein [Chloroflexi bacterium AL-N10]NOK76129.1 hypothetical protein [Chloroflexi bacterium AL-N5]NOK84234.1 hypothetical protein [Chloroflexi bacterium AL-W]NOK91267.1 hypothetical protein [Chloroflexi bacterium AL-N15]
MGLLVDMPIDPLCRMGALLPVGRDGSASKRELSIHVINSAATHPSGSLCTLSQSPCSERASGTNVVFGGSDEMTAADPAPSRTFTEPSATIAQRVSGGMGGTGGRWTLEELWPEELGRNSVLYSESQLYWITAGLMESSVALRRSKRWGATCPIVWIGRIVKLSSLIRCFST